MGPTYEETFRGHLNLSKNNKNKEKYKKLDGF